MKTNKQGRKAAMRQSAAETTVILGLFSPLKSSTNEQHSSGSDLDFAFNMFVFYFMVKSSCSKKKKKKKSSVFPVAKIVPPNSSHCFQMFLPDL